MVTTEIKTIKPAAGGGGDYSSLNAWELAERANAYPTIPNGNLVSADKIKVAEVYSGGNAITAQLNINRNNWTTDATRYIIIRAAAGHEHTGVWNTSKAYILNASIPLLCQYVVNVKIERMQIKGTGNAAIYSWAYNDNFGGMDLDQCLIMGSPSGGYRGVIDFVVSSWERDLYVRNCIIIDQSSVNANFVIQNESNKGFKIYVYNSTLIGNSQATVYGIYSICPSVSQNNYIKATICYAGCTPGANDATSNANAVTLNLRNVAYSTANFINVTPGSENLRLVVSQANKLIDNGANLASSGVTTDIVGTARPLFGGFDIGAFENDVPICWNYTARYKNSNKLFKASGCGSFPRNLQVPSNVDSSTGKMVDDGIFISPDRYNIT